MRVWCDECGDMTVAYVPIEVMFFDGSRLTMNLCVGCWTSLKASSRKVKVARILKLWRERANEL